MIALITLISLRKRFSEGKSNQRNQRNHIISGFIFSIGKSHPTPRVQLPNQNLFLHITNKKTSQNFCSETDSYC